MKATTARRIGDLEKRRGARRGGEILMLPDDLSGDDWLASVFNLEMPDGRRGLRLNAGVDPHLLLTTLTVIYGDPDPPERVV